MSREYHKILFVSPSRAHLKKCRLWTHSNGQFRWPCKIENWTYRNLRWSFCQL